ncbi:MAG: MBOAT family protein, partial [bacterium]|nr:MBOAT family protein [bacterium]
MAFYSFRFFVFFPLIVAAYYTLPLRFRRVFLLTASYYFYFCFKPSFVLILLASTAVDYYLGIAVHRQRIKSKRKILFVVGLLNNLGLLFLFKYFNFFNDTLRALFESVNILYDIKGIGWILPVGISYYTFKKISYLIDVYRETLPPERNAVTFALYTSFFPAVTAGPIDRPGSLMPQFKKQVKFDYHGVTEGLKLMAWGFFKKLIIADRLALFVNQVYDNPT